MTLPTHERTIDGLSYETTILDADQGRKILVRVMKIMAGGAAAAGEKMNKGSWAAGMSGIAGLLERLSDEDLGVFIKTFGARSTVLLDSGNRVRIADVYLLHFAGKMLAMMDWLTFCIEVNYSDFFDGVRAKLAEIWGSLPDGTPKPKTDPSGSQPTSIGGSGDSSAANESE